MNTAALTEHLTRYPNVLATPREAHIARKLHGLGLDIRDVNNDIVVKLYHKFHTYDPSRGSLSTWISRVALNHCKDVRNKQAKDLGWAKGAEVTRVTHDPEPVEETECPLLSVLHPTRREIIRRRFFDDDTNRQIAQDLDVSRSYVERLYAEALTTLRKHHAQV